MCDCLAHNKEGFLFLMDSTAGFGHRSYGFSPAPTSTTTGRKHAQFASLSGHERSSSALLLEENAPPDPQLEHVLPPGKLYHNGNMCQTQPHYL